MFSSLTPSLTACKQIFCNPTIVSALMSRMKLTVCTVMTAPFLSGVCLETSILSGNGAVTKLVRFSISKSYFFAKKKSLRVFPKTTEGVSLAI